MKSAGKSRSALGPARTFWLIRQNVQAGGLEWRSRKGLCNGSEGRSEAPQPVPDPTQSEVMMMRSAGLIDHDRQTFREGPVKSPKAELFGLKPEKSDIGARRAEHQGPVGPSEGLE